MRKYEIMTLTKGSQGEDKAKELSKKVSELISSFDGKVTNSDFWGKRALAYEIRQETEGFYEVIEFEIPEEKIEDLKVKLNLENNLVRYLITAIELKEE